MKTKRLLFILVVLLSSQVLIAGTPYSHELTPSGYTNWHMNVDLGVRQTMPQTMVVAGNSTIGYKTYFSATYDGGSEGLWCTDGVHTAERVWNSKGDPNGFVIRRLTALNDKVLFTCSNSNDLDHDSWLWFSDCTQPNHASWTGIMETNELGYSTTYGDVQAIVQLNDHQVVFLGKRYNNETKKMYDDKLNLFISDGTPGGTKLLYNNWQGARYKFDTKSVLDVDCNMIRVGNKVFFEAKENGKSCYDVWATDGTNTYNASNYDVANVKEDANNCNFVNVNDKWLAYTYEFTENKNTDNERTAYTLAKIGVDNKWKDYIWWDPAYTQNKDYFRKMAAMGDYCYFTAYDPETKEYGYLWKCDMNNNALTKLSGGPFRFPDILGVFNGNLMVVLNYDTDLDGNDNPGTCQLWKYDGANIVHLSNFSVAFQDNGYAIVNDWFYTYGLVGTTWGIHRIKNLSDYPTQVTNQIAWHPIISGNGYKLIDNKGRLVYALNGGEGRATVTKLYSYEYTDDAMTLTESDNSSTIANNAAKLVNATINRTMNTTSGYYTICLPFDMTNDQLITAFGSGYDLEEFTGTTTINGKLTLNFTQVTELKHGVPYLILPAQSVSSSTIPNCWVHAGNPATVEHDGVQFIGTYNPKTLDDYSSSTPYRLLGSDNKLYRPNSNNAMKGLRGYFKVGDGVNAVYVSIRHADNTATEIPLVEEQLTPRVQKIVKDNKVMILRNGKTYDIMGRLITK